MGKKRQTPKWHRNKLYQRIVKAMGRKAGIRQGSGVKFKEFAPRVLAFYGCSGDPQEWAFSNATKILGTVFPARDPKRIPSAPKKETFFESKEWLQLRYDTLKRCGRKCLVCGRGPNEGIVLHVDHIKPRSLYPSLSLDPNNLQVLCSDCNIGKLNRDSIDWRSSPPPQEQTPATH